MGALAPAAVTRHAAARMQQRAVSAEVLDCLLDFGHEEHDHHGGGIVHFNKAARRQLLTSQGRDAFKRLERYLNAYAVVGADGCVVTVGRRYRRIRRA
jgi:hypothetical protein